MCSQWLIIFMLLPFLQVDLTPVAGLDGYVKGAEHQIDRFGIDKSYVYRVTSKYAGLNLTLSITFNEGNEPGIKLDSNGRYSNLDMHLVRLSDNKYSIQHTDFGPNMTLDVPAKATWLSKPIMSKIDVNRLGQHWILTKYEKFNSNAWYHITNDRANQIVNVNANGITIVAKTSQK
ncbi:unnamed protein product, partial [Adineta steineri]